jgi:hypothetical protein
MKVGSLIITIIPIANKLTQNKIKNKSESVHILQKMNKSEISNN